MRNSIAPGIAIALAGAFIAASGIHRTLDSAHYSPGPPHWILTPQTLTIQDRYFPYTIQAAEVDLEHVRIVDLNVEGEWRPGLRTRGFSNGHYRSGWFRAANGKAVLVYWTGWSRVVLVPAKTGGAPMLLEVADPDDFIHQLWRNWRGTF